MALFSDVGAADYSLAQLQGDVHAGFPAARVVYGATDMPAFDVAAAAYIIDLASGPYPEGTIIVGAVTPGDLPGTSCLAAVSKRGHVFVAPDNGLLTRVARDPGPRAVYRIEEQSLFPRPLKDASADWALARAAALIASGRAPRDLGPPASTITTLDLADARPQDDRLTGTAVFIDRFGNCLTNIPAGLAGEMGLRTGDSVTVSWAGGRATMKAAGAYGDVPLGAPLALSDGGSPLQLAINGGSFAEKYGAGAGAAVTLTRAGDQTRAGPAATQEAVLSRTFTAVEGFPGVDLAYPVLRPDETLADSVSALLEVEVFLGGLIEPPAADAPLDKVWRLDADGVILYDPDAAQVGTTLFLDPLCRPYPDLLTLGRRIARRPSGSGGYELPAKSSAEVIVKDATWMSAGLHGTPWRLVAAFAGQDQSEQAPA